MCGGTRNGGRRHGNESGLSPRVRGNPRPVPGGRRAVRSIPACAGEPPWCSSTPRSPTVYPRVCGGTSGEPPCPSTAPGLSPRVRGNPAGLRFLAGVARSIPACAGEPRSRPSGPGNRRVYPRVCGGTCWMTPLTAAKAGLSPRVRGNLRPRSDTYALRRSIPACAGEPSSRAARHGTSGVYPRVCGGTSYDSSHTTWHQGLSPRVRGNRRRPASGARPQGSIPACAGEPRGQRIHAARHRVYPRVCGGTADLPGIVYRKKGLSPRVRGNRL